MTEPIDPRHLEIMNALARGLDEIFNADAKGRDRKVGFALFIFPLGEPGGRCNYISNGNRRDIVAMLKAQIDHFEKEAAC